MTFTYLLSDNIGKIRLVIGDTTAPAVFSDEELTYFLTANSNNINLAAADALEAWAAKYTASPDSEKIGDYAYSQKITDKMLALAANLEETDASTPYLTWAEFDLSGVEED